MSLRRAIQLEQRAPKHWRLARTKKQSNTRPQKAARTIRNFKNSRANTIQSMQIGRTADEPAFALRSISGQLSSSILTAGEASKPSSDFTAGKKLAVDELAD